MNHSFLLKSARWSVDGYCQKKEQPNIGISGFISISWKRENWFKMVTQLSVEDSESPDLISQCKGHLDHQRKSYTYVLQHNILGNIEGEGYLSYDSVIQYYWIVGTDQRRIGLDTFYRLSEDDYHFTGVSLERHNLISTMEATLKHLI